MSDWVYIVVAIAGPIITGVITAAGTHRMHEWRIAGVEKHFSNGIYSEIKAARRDIAEVQNRLTRIETTVELAADRDESPYKRHGHYTPPHGQYRRHGEEDV